MTTLSSSSVQTLQRLQVCRACPQRAGCQVQFRARLPEESCEHWPAAAAGVLVLASRAAQETARWVMAGAAGLTEEERAVRTRACEGDAAAGVEPCPHWDAKAFAGSGRCQHPSCGCSRLKREMRTARCPMGKWPELG